MTWRVLLIVFQAWLMFAFPGRLNWSALIPIPFVVLSLIAKYNFDARMLKRRVS